ncbi:MAG TPA: thiol reductase thioredoxin [Streptomyces sp.]|nr:thiol reductase thioredoxin [Streptomyces sp.]
MLRNMTVAAATVVALLGGVAPAVAASHAETTASSPVMSADPTVIDVTAANYEQVMQMSHTKPVVLDFTASWCYWCQKQKPYLQKFNADDGGSWIWARVDVDRNRDLSRKYRINGIPDLLNIQKGVEAGSRHQGFDGPAALRTWLDNL